MACCGTLVSDRIESTRLVPSDRTWRLRNYYMLVEKQRRRAPQEEPHDTRSDDDTTEIWSSTVNSEKYSEDRLHQNVVPVSSSPSPIPELKLGTTIRRPSSHQQLRDLSNLVKAGCLLARCPVSVDFQHEEEQRVVLSLVYDAFRYRSVFNQALQDTKFFTTFPQFIEESMLVHLILWQLYTRRFCSRVSWPPGSVSSLQSLWVSTGMALAEDSLWEVRVRLAAALARLRIKNNALRLEQLLPSTLQRDEDSLGDTAAWVNTFKISVEEVTRVLDEAGLTQDEKLTVPLERQKYRIESFCPGLIHFHAILRADIAQSQLVRDSFIVLQGRSFCLGPSVFCRVLTEFALIGSVAQTHVSSPRTTAYLASLLAAASAPAPPRTLVTFGAGSRKEKLEYYFESLGVPNVKVHAKKFSELSPDSSLLDGIVAVLAHPPNSNSAIKDPVELACTSDEALEVLEKFASAAECDKGSREGRRSSLLHEQSATLRLALASPQIQFVLFESHSDDEVETRQLILQEVESANDAARHRSLRLPAEFVGVEETVVTNTHDKETAADTQDQEQPPPTPASSSSIMIPPTDVFEVSALQPAPPSQDGEDIEEDEVDMCPALQEEGCYLALIRRQEITRLDAQYMIQIAESRGLFGGSNKKKVVTSSKRTPRKKPPDLKQLLNQGKQKMKERRAEGEADRITAPTVASLLRQSVPSVLGSEVGGDTTSCADCPRHAKAKEPPPDLCSRYHFARRQDARRWWSEAAQRVLALSRISNPALLPRFRLVRTPLPGPGATGRELYPMSVHDLAFHENVNFDPEEEDQEILEISDHDDLLCSIRIRDDRDSSAKSLVSFVTKTHRYC